jgi:hypothetical protein
MTTREHDWLYVAKRQGKAKFIKAFKRFDPRRVEWTTNVDEAAEFTELEWRRERAMDFILAEHLCLVSYADEPRKPGKRPTGDTIQSRETFSSARRLRASVSFHRDRRAQPYDNVNHTTRNADHRGRKIGAINKED